MLTIFVMGVAFQDGAGRLALLQEIALALSSELDRRRLFEGIVRGARRLLDVPVAVVASWDGGREELVIEAAEGFDPPTLSAPPGEMPASVGRAFNEKRTVVVDDLLAHPRASRYARELTLHAAVATPLLRNGKVLAIVLCAHREPARRFDHEDVRLLEVLAGHCSLALGNAEILTAATRRLARVEELANAARGVVEARARNVVIDRALDCATTVLGADRAAVFLVEGVEEVRVAYAAGRRLPPPFLERIAKEYGRTAGGLLPFTRSSIFVPDAATDARTRAIHLPAMREGIRSMLFVPLLHRDAILGTLAVFHDVVWIYDPEELSQIRTLSDQVALALANAALHEQAAQQLAQLRVLDATMRAVSEPLPVRERCERGAQAMVDGGGAAAVWVLLGDGSEVIQAGHSAVDLAAVRQLGRAAAESRRHVHGDAGVVAAPLIHREQSLGVLVMQRPRVAQAQPRQGTTVLRLSAEPELDEGPREQGFVGTAAGQVATAIANARLNEEARTMSARLAVVIGGMPDAVLVFDRTDRIVFYNRKVLEIYGLKGVDLTGWTPRDFVREVGHCYEDPAMPLEIARRVEEEKDKEHRISFVLVKPKRRVIQRISAPVLTPDGEWFGQVVLYHDLTDLPESPKLRALP